MDELERMLRLTLAEHAADGTALPDDGVIAAAAVRRRRKLVIGIAMAVLLLAGAATIVGARPKDHWATRLASGGAETSTTTTAVSLAPTSTTTTIGLTAPTSSPATTTSVPAESGPGSPSTTPGAAAAPALPATSPVPEPCTSASVDLSKIHVLDMAATSSGTWFALGNEAPPSPSADGPSQTPVLVRTADGGASWRTLCLPGSGGADAAAFVDEQHGWVGLHDETRPAILRTTDGGASWQPGRLPSDFVVSTEIHFIDRLRGWAGGVSGSSERGQAAVLRTTDGGVTWTPASKAFGLDTIARLEFVDTTRGYAIDHQHVAATEDGGRSWIVRDLGWDLQDLAVGDSSMAWVVGGRRDTAGNEGVVWSTTDGGRTWERRDGFPWMFEGVVAVGPPPFAVRAYSQQPAEVQISRDGGRSWERRNTPADFRDASFQDAQSAWAASFTEPWCAYRTRDGGRTWDGYPLPLGRDRCTRSSAVEF